jgi:hypothetical protein
MASKPAKKKETKTPKKASSKKVVKKITKVADQESAPYRTTSCFPAVAQAGYPKSGQRVELWAYDEYNQGSIVASGDLDTVVKKAKQFVTEQNVDNALAMAEKNNSWEAYFPLFYNGDALDFEKLYAGDKRNGKHHVYNFVDGKWQISELPAGTKLRFYLGEVNNGKTKSDWFLADHLKREINVLTNNLLERKTVLFVKIL